MITAPLPTNEVQRLETLGQYHILDSEQEAAYDDIVHLASQICGTPIVLINLVDENRVWVKSKIGLSVEESPRDTGFCPHAILQTDPLIINDTLVDNRFVDNPYVTGDPHIRFYAGVPLITANDYALGTLCVVDRVPRSLTPDQLTALTSLGRQVVSLLELRRTVVLLRQTITAQEQTEAALRENVVTYQALLKAIPDLILRLDPSGTITSVKAANSQENYLPQPPDQLVGKKLAHVLPSEIVQGFQECIQQALQTAMTQIYHYQLEITNNPHHFELSCSVSREDEVIAIVRDNTARIQALEAVKESEARYRHLVEFSSEAIIIHIEGKIVFANPAAVRLFGAATPKELPANLYNDLIHPANVERVKAVVEKSDLEEESTGLFEMKYVKLDGKVIECEVIGMSTMYQGQRARQVFIRDISQRKQTEEALRQSQATNRALFGVIPDVMLGISREGIMTKYSAGRDQYLLIQPADFLYKNVVEFLPAGLAHSVLQDVERTLSTGVIQVKEYQLLVKAKLQYLECRFVISSPDEVIMIVRDITDRKLLEEETLRVLAKERELSELKSRFVTTTSHEFRTPLSVILSSTELLEHYGSRFTEEKKLMHLHRIQTAVSNMSQLLNDVLIVGKIEAGKLELKPTLFDPIEFCNKLVEELQLIAGTGDTIKFISYKSGATNDLIYLDETLLRQIVSNLLSNALKYSPQGGAVQFEIRLKSQEIIFQVQDYGIGIPSSEQVNLFNPFYRGSNVGTISGTGLGLAIVKKSVELHGGRITVASQVGVGTTFTVTIPACKSDDESAIASFQASAGLANKN